MTESSRSPIRRRVHRETMKAKGICINCCRNPALQERVLCEECNNKQNIKCLERKKKRIKEGKCVWCINPSVPGRKKCQEHLNQDNERQKQARQKCKIDGVCTRCYLQPATNGILCLECLQKNKKYREDWIKAKTAAGLCTLCGKVSSLKSGMQCLTCYFKIMSKRYFNTNKRWQELQDLFDKQNGICPYSGLTLNLGIDTQLDHIIPVTKDGKDVIENFQWIHWRANEMKRDMMEEEFIWWIKTIHQHLKL